MACRVLGAFLRGGVLKGGFPGGYTSVFYLFFILKRSLSMYGPLESLPAYFKKNPINPVHPSLDITV